MHRSAEGCVLTFGGSGKTGASASRNCAVWAYQSSKQRLLPVHRRVSGACPVTSWCKGPCAITISTRPVYPDFTPMLSLNPIEPPWYETRMPGGVGGAESRGSPLSRSSIIIGRRWQISIKFGVEKWRLLMLLGAVCGSLSIEPTHLRPCRSSLIMVTVVTSEVLPGKTQERTGMRSRNKPTNEADPAPRDGVSGLTSICPRGGECTQRDSIGQETTPQNSPHFGMLSSST